MIRRYVYQRVALLLGYLGAEDRESGFLLGVVLGCCFTVGFVVGLYLAVVLVEAWGPA